MFWNAPFSKKIFLMSGLYLLLDGITVFFPLLLSFDKRVQFYKEWKFVLLATLIVAIPFLIWDELFTQNHYWGFNPEYLVGVYLGHLPLEELLFFLVVPFACVFILACARYYFRKLNLSFFNHIFYIGMSFYSVIILGLGMAKGIAWYSIIVGLTAIATLFVCYKKSDRLKFLPLAFLLSMIPFFIVNGVLTGTGIDAPIVWYDSNQFSDIRILTIPIEDVLYSWTLISLNVLIYSWLRLRFNKRLE